MAAGRYEMAPIRHGDSRLTNLLIYHLRSKRYEARAHARTVLSDGKIVDCEHDCLCKREALNNTIIDCCLFGRMMLSYDIIAL